MSVIHESMPARFMVQRRKASDYQGAWKDEQAFGSMPEAVDEADFLANLFPGERYRVVDGAK